jgi:shikimate dehydrogenase
MKITAYTRPLGLIGHPVSHSKSPEMLNEACRVLGIPAVYLAYAVDPSQLEQAVRGMKAMNFIGFNVTIPHKVAIIPFLEELDDTAAEIGAVNTVVNRDGKLIGYNTDGIGYLRSLTEETAFALHDKTVTVLGAGGAARAVSITLAKAGVKELIIANRTLEKAEQLAEVVNRWTTASGVSLQESSDAIDKSHLLVNTTSIGMSPSQEQSPIPSAYLHPTLLVSDLVYRPRETKLLQMATSIGASTHGGLGMLLYQAAVAFEHWFLQSAPVSKMRTILENGD